MLWDFWAWLWGFFFWGCQDGESTKRNMIVQDDKVFGSGALRCYKIFKEKFTKIYWQFMIGCSKMSRDSPGGCFYGGEMREDRRPVPCLGYGRPQKIVIEEEM